MGGKSQGQAESDESASQLACDYHSPSAIGVLPERGPARVSPTSFGFTSLRKVKLFRAAEVRAALKLAVNKHVELVIPGRHVADVDPLHAALAQGLELFDAVDVVRNELAVDLEPHGVEAHLVALGERDEDRDLRP